MTDDVILAERDGGVLALTLNRPERMNAWTPEMEARLLDVVTEADGDPAVRAIVLTGAGRGFCPGPDLGGIELDGGMPASERQLTSLTQTRKPLIAAINGACAGIGLIVALCCDVRFASAGVKLATSFARRGLVAEHGLSWLLYETVGRGRALDLLLSGRTVLAEEALDLGVVNFVCPPDTMLADARAYASDLADHCSPTAMAAIKRQVAEHGALGPAVELADVLTAQSFGWPDLAEGMASWGERRPPRYPALP